MSFSDNLRKLRIEKGMSQKTLADLINVSQTAVYHWEKGLRSPKIEQLQRISTVLNVPIADLIDKSTLSLTNDMISLFCNDSPEVLDTIMPTNAQENYLIFKFRDLNEAGKKRVTDYIDDLVESPKYCRKEKRHRPIRNGNNNDMQESVNLLDDVADNNKH